MLNFGKKLGFYKFSTTDFTKNKIKYQLNIRVNETYPMFP